MFRTRLISGIVLLLIILITLTGGGWLLWLSLLIYSLVGMFELYRVLGFEKTPLGYAGYGGAVLMYLTLGLGLRWINPFGLDLPFAVCIALIAGLFLFVLQYPKYPAYQLFGMVFGAIYIPFALSYIFQIRENLLFGKYLVWMVYAASWGSDTCAYCAGMLLGKHKLAPVLSPKKSIEGSVGGILGSAILGLLVGMLMSHFAKTPPHLLPLFAIIGGCGSVISQIGDLAASGIKRNYDIKDYGKLIPGHGGILDRFDSVIITAPIIYYLCVFLLRGHVI